MLRSLFILFFCFHWIPCIAQSFAEKNFTRYTKLDGLSNNYVTDIVQDSTGYIWVATYEGLNRFDGSGFQSFLKSSNHNPIPDNTISSMQLFGNRLVIATDDGAQVISTKTLQQTNLFIPGSDALRYWSNACRYVCPDRQGNYLVSTKTGLYIFSPDGRIKKRYDYYTDKDIGNSWMLFGSRLYNLPDGNVMQLNSNGLLFFDRVKNNISDPQTLFPGLKKLLSIWREEKTIFFFISSTRVLVFNFKNNSFDIIDITTGKVTSLKASFDLHKEIGWQTRLTFLYNNQWALSSKRQGFFIATIDTVNNNVNCLPSKYLPNHMCNAVFADKQNRLWIGAEDGLYMQSLHPKIITTFEILNKTNEPSSITSLFLTENKIIAGTSKKQILILDKQSKQIIHSISLPHPPLENSVINQIIEIEPDTLWMAVSREIWWLNKMNFSYGKLELKKVSDSADFIRFLYLDKSNRVWIPVNSINTVYQYDRGTGDLKVISKKEHPLFKVNAINSIVEDKEGNIWISGDAAIKWNSKIQSIDTLIEYLPTQTNRKKGIIVMADLEGEIWAMLNDDGFARFTNKPTHIRPQNIRYTKIGSLLPTLLLDKIFIPVDDGVIFKEKDGLPERAITTQYFVADPTNKSTWFACGNILCNLPLSPEQYYVKPPLLTISELSVINDTTIHFPEV